ncbi:hypothetical protein [Motiliproteus sediminis]|uniref:hypothetical protein n=1 Tax=Motiliproteus sediminis TaxID=1468178 RepID=UPI001AEF84A2|nr:hypothetical protein [Motiliproteus sediminis]
MTDTQDDVARQLSESMVEADFLWREIGVGDRVMVEHAYDEAGVELLTPGRAYQVIAKPVSESGVLTLLVESNLPEHLVTLYPQHVASYDASGRILLS